MKHANARLSPLLHANVTFGGALLRYRGWMVGSSVMKAGKERLLPKNSPGNPATRFTAAPAGQARSSSVFWTRDDGRLGVHSYCPETDVAFSPHTYAEYTLVVCLEGEIAKTQLGQSEWMGRGGVLFGNHGIEHTSGYRSTHGKRCEAVVVSIERRLMAQLAGEFNLPALTEENSLAFLGRLENQVIHDCARNIAAELRGGLPGHTIVVENLSLRMLVEALRAWPQKQVHQVAADLSPRLPRRDFVRAHEFMRWCRKENFRLQNLCRFLGTSEERFARLFFASTQHSPASFYNRMLLERARELLSDANLPVKEVGYLLGYKTSSHFIAAFRREFQTTPQEYRESQRRQSRKVTVWLE